MRFKVHNAIYDILADVCRRCWKGWSLAVEYVVHTYMYVMPLRAFVLEHLVVALSFTVVAPKGEEL